MQTNNNYASFWIRALASIIDILISLTGTLLAVWLLSISSIDIYAFIPSMLWTILYIFLIQALLFFFLVPYLISLFGGAFGKLITQLEIVTPREQTYQTLTYKQALFREYIAKIASASLLGVGYFWIFKTSERQAWHDMLANTYVIKKNNLGVLFGLIAAVVLIGFQVLLVTVTVNNFSTNTQLQENFKTMIDTIEKSLPDSEPDVAIPENVENLETM